MQKFHSIEPKSVSRRAFVKALGVGIGGLGAAAAAVPVFHDIDEIIQTGQDIQVKEPMPWWVRERDYLNPTVEVDWNVLQQFDKDSYNNNTAHLTAEHVKARSDAEMKQRKDKILANFPGHRLQDIGLNLCGRVMRSHTAKGAYGIGAGSEQLELLGMQRTDTGYGTSAFTYYCETPQERGVPIYQGTPEENTHMMRCISRYAGGTQCGFSILDEKTSKFMWKGKSWNWVDDPNLKDPTYVNGVYNIPKALRYVCNPIIQQDIGGTRRPPTNYSGLNVGKGYFQSALANVRLHAFIKTLGYHSFGANSAGANTGFGVMSGAGEVLRLHELSSPYVGPLFRRANIFCTDLPMVATNPIDMGVTRFCYTCRKCSNLCPTGAIPTFAEPSWDITPASSHAADPDNLKPTLFNQPGKKIWYLNHFACQQNWIFTDSGCGICQGACVFSKMGVQSIHSLVKTTVSMTPIFNGFFTNMDKFFGYGNIGYDPNVPAPGSTAEYTQKMEEMNSWWNEPRPIYGLNY